MLGFPRFMAIKMRGIDPINQAGASLLNRFRSVPVVCQQAINSRPKLLINGCFLKLRRTRKSELKDIFQHIEYRSNRSPAVDRDL